ncbi:helix-turn-helix domain-containing protein [Lactococcus lactis]|uniref:Helix-turn-helix domain-containing protein n=2 Tax=Lactococcus lactis TaxID=1358 RepID=A0AAP5PCY9_9LACT|nr:helix-turn-helix domain-containing protein [Lactococcus lactis]MDT2860538.1 helix-turn-helix domain-containing protein [Lactococcus lactis]MDT2863332.1 helix-turn-helix domain-containing protein [Lactococcus lactis]MDT2868702.1 helix-turn-helix domain-containing protein [Lactococcus lactis]MDT2874211.1 helix-turn-helix domain-containing protein [Lactococcus lactis]MDT2876817.1 helix-turn-helix domain-containing protein [Lactococcus lactis]
MNKQSNNKKMVYQRYGKTFKNIRLQKMLSLSFCEKVGISKSTIYRFESGQAMIGFDSLLIALYEMGVTLAEYEMFLNDFIESYQEEIISAILRADYFGDVSEKKQIYRQCIESKDNILALTVKATYSKLETYEVDSLLSFMSEIKLWGYYELSVFYMILEILSECDIIRFLDNLFLKEDQLNHVFKYKRRMLEIYYKSSVILTFKGRQAASYNILKKACLKKIIDDLYLNNIKNIANGFFIFHFENKEKGLKKIEEGLNMFENFGHGYICKFYQKKYQDIKYQI